MGKIILGSQSPRRAEILKKLDIDFEITPSSYVEKHDQTDFSYDFVEESAFNKALYIAKDLYAQKKDCKIIGADTIVVIDNKILEKPKSYDDAFRMLSLLSARTHFVVTAVAIVNSIDFSSIVQSDTTYVTFEKLTKKQIDDYITNYKPYDKAGAYGIQELPNGFVKKVEGELDNVIGLPLKVVKELLLK